MTRVLICGGRNFQNRTSVYEALDMFHMRFTIDLLIHNRGPGGAVRIADDWAVENYVPVLRVPPKYKLFGESAMFHCNSEMLKIGKPDLVLTFPGTVWTNDLVEKAHGLGGVEVVMVENLLWTTPKDVPKF